MRFLQTFLRSAKAHVFTLAPHHQSPLGFLGDLEDLENLSHSLQDDGTEARPVFGCISLS